MLVIITYSSVLYLSIIGFAGKSGSGSIRIPNVLIFSIKNILLKTMFFVVIYELVIVLKKSKKKYDILIILVEFYVN